MSIKCAVCNKTIRKNQKFIGTMHEKCHAAFTKKPDLYKHQAATKRLLKRSDYVFDMSDPGTGKTRPALEAWAERRRKGGGCALVIAVKLNLESVWINEVHSWVPDMVPSVAYANNRGQAFAQKSDLYITNTDATKWIASQRPNFFTKFDTIIVDESSYFKHRTSQRSKALIRIKDHFKHKELMSGTPTSTGICDIWNQVYFLDGGQTLGSSFFRFREQVCKPVQVGPDRLRHVQWVDKPLAEEAVTSLIAKFCIRHDIDECTDIPKNYIHRYRYDLPRKLMAQYQHLEATSYLELKKGAAVGTNAAVLRGKLFQLCSGAVYTGADQYEAIDKQRYKIVADLIEERECSVCFFNWKHQRDLIIEELKKRKISHAYLDGSVTSDKKRVSILNGFEAGEYRTILIHPRTGAHGLNQLIRAKHVIWPSPIYEADLMKQGIHRVRRSGQKSRTETIIVTANRTVEEIIYARRENKQQHMTKFFDIIKESHEEFA